MEITVCIVTLILLVAALAFTRLHAVWAFFLANVVFLVFGIIDVPTLLQGLANEQLAVLVLMLLISELFRRRQLLETLLSRFWKKDLNGRQMLLGMTSGIGLTSAFLNNTPLVAMFSSHLLKWCNNKGLSPSRFLLPLSYASILGGCMTLIGTSTNLIANGLAIDLGLPGLDVFDFTPVGAAMFVVGLAYLWWVAPKLIPERRAADQFFLNSQRQYLIEARVSDASELQNKSVEAAGLRNLKGTFLVQIIRNGDTIQPVGPQTVIKAGDTLIFTGNPKVVSDLTKKKWGLEFPEKLSSRKRYENSSEIVISRNSHLAGKKVKDTDFRARYDGAILAVHRNGDLLKGKVGDIQLRAGDVLLVLEGSDFRVRTRNNPGFYVIDREPFDNHYNRRELLWVATGFLATLVLAAGGWVPLSLALLCFFGILLLFEGGKAGNLRSSIDYHLILLIVFSLSLGQGLVASGGAGYLAHFLDGLRHISAFWQIVSLFLLSNLLSSFLTSKAALAILMPITVPLVMSGIIDGKTLVLCLALGAAANFMTPFGYQTNLMVYGPGNYRFMDFVKAGLPLTLLYALVCALILG